MYTLFCENQIMNGKNIETITMARILAILLVLSAGMTVFPTAASARSLYVIADKWGNAADSTLPVQAYDIGVDGTLAFQAQCAVRNRGLGAVAMAIDSDSGYVFITYGNRNVIQLLDPITMTDAGTTDAPDASDLAAIVYDHKKKLLYTIDRGGNDLYVYRWEPKMLSLTHVEGSPFTLSRSSAYGIALDEIDDLLYVASASNSVRVYRTSNWELVKTITLSRMAISVAVDVRNGFLYTGAGFAGNTYLTQYHLPTSTERETQVELDAGVLGLAVDPDTGLIYLDTGRDNEPGGDDLLVYDTALRRIDSVFNIGNPTGLAIPVKQIGYNPLNLRKTVVEGPGGSATNGILPVGPGETITYEIHFDNNNSFTATDVSILDVLPDGVTFVNADNATGMGQYNSKTRTYKWSYASVAPGSSDDLALTVQVSEDVEIGRTIVNSATIDSNEIPRTTTSASVITANNPLNLTKSILGGVDDRVKGVDTNEPVTYTICFDNNDNDFVVTDVTVVDVLPDEVTFVAAGEGKAHGVYDAATHSYTWSYPFLVPGSSVCLGLVVRVNPNVAPGTVITNSAIIDSNETSPTTASVDAVMYLNPLSISKSIFGAVDGQPKWVSAGEKITYAISFQNTNDSPVNNVLIVDALPKEASFVRARSDDPAAFGRYDAKTHTYTWSYTSLSPAKSPTLLDIVVQVNKSVVPGTTITNSVTIDSDQTPPAAASAQAVTFYSVPSLTKYVVGSVVGESESANADDTVVYAIHFDNANDSALTNVSIVDTLPQELSFISADGDGSFGRYDAKSHAFTWTYPALAPKSSTHLELTGRVKKGLSPLATITNVATLTSGEISPATASVDVLVGEGPLRIQLMRMVPELINSAGGTYEVQAVLVLPAGIGIDDIKDVLPTLYPGRVRAKRQLVYGTGTAAKVIALFDKAELAAAIPGDGQVQVKVVGKLKTGRSFFGEASLFVGR
jgi:uncharacterized repeat protein (TIGR01451 family)